MRYRWTTAQRPTNPPVGTSGFNTSLGVPEVWTGAAWLTMSGGAAGIETIHAYDGPGGAAIGGQIPMTVVSLNTAPLNYSLPGGGIITVATPGSYLIRHSVGFVGQAPNAISNYQAVLQATPTGLGMWANIIGADAYCERVNPAGRVGTMTGEGAITIGAAHDFQLMSAVLIGSPAASQPQGSRIIIERVA